MSRSHIYSTAVNTSMEPWWIHTNLHIANEKSFQKLAVLTDWLYELFATCYDWRGEKDSKRLATSAVTRASTQNLKTSCFSQLWNVCTICRECKYTRSNGKKANCWKDWAQKKMLVMRKNLWGCRGEMTLLLKIYWMQTVFTVIPKGTTPPLHYQLHHWTQHGVHVLIGGSDEVFLWSNPSSSRRTSVRQ